MSLAEGTITASADWTSSCDKWKTLLTSITGIACTSDSGTGNSRILLFSVQGTNKHIKLWYYSTSYSSINIMQADDTTILYPTSDRIYYKADMTYKIIVNGNLTMFYAYYSSTYQIKFMWSKTGETYRFYFRDSLIHPTLDSLIATALPITYALGLKTQADAQILTPMFTYDGSTSFYIDVPLENVYVFPNLDTLALHTKVSISSVVYFLYVVGVLVKSA